MYKRQEYGLLAEKIEYPSDRKWVIYHLNPKARFHDGEPVKPEDVIFTFNTLLEKGAPFYKSYYGEIKKVEKLGPQKVKFHFDPETTNRELVLITGQLPVLPSTTGKDVISANRVLNLPWAVELTKSKNLRLENTSFTKG